MWYIRRLTDMIQLCSSHNLRVERWTMMFVWDCCYYIKMRNMRYNRRSFRIKPISVSLHFDNLIDRIIEACSFTEKWIGILNSFSRKWIKKGVTLPLDASNENPKLYDASTFAHVFCSRTRKTFIKTTSSRLRAVSAYDQSSFSIELRDVGYQMLDWSVCLKLSHG